MIVGQEKDGQTGRWADGHHTRSKNDWPNGEGRLLGWRRELSPHRLVSPKWPSPGRASESVTHQQTESELSSLWVTTRTSVADGRTGRGTEGRSDGRTDGYYTKRTYDWPEGDGRLVGKQKKLSLSLSIAVSFPRKAVFRPLWGITIKKGPHYQRPKQKGSALS